MIINIKQNIKLAGIGFLPWNRLGPEKWLSDYAIATLHDWDLGTKAGLPKVHALSDRLAELPAIPVSNTQSLLRMPQFRSMLEDELPDYALLTYKPIIVPPELKNRRFLTADWVTAQRFGNKILFREFAKNFLRFPDYAIYRRRDLEKNMAAYKKLAGKRSKIVLQDEALSGGKGTFIIANFEQYCQAVNALGRLSKHENVLISDCVEGAKERSIQCCVTRFGIFTGPLQRQIVAHPLLSYVAADGDKFCGAQIIASDQSTELHKKIAKTAKEIGKKLQSHGYSGIFGVDFLLSAEDELFVLEVNPRTTGVTPLLTALYPEEDIIPLYLLHLLELGHYEYEIGDKTIGELGREGSLLILHSLEDNSLRIKEAPQSGTYTVSDGKLRYVSDSISLLRLKKGEFIMQKCAFPNMAIKPGGRLAILQLRQTILDEKTGELYNNIENIINLIHKNIITEVLE